MCLSIHINVLHIWIYVHSINIMHAYICYILHVISIIHILCVCITNDVCTCTYALYGFVIDFKYTYICAYHIYMFIALYIHVIYVLYII